MLSWLSLLYMCGLGLCPFRRLVCDLLLRGGRGLSPDCALPEEYLGHNLDEHCLEQTGESGSLPTRACGGEAHHKIATKLRENFPIFSICRLAATASRHLADLQQSPKKNASSVASRVLCPLAAAASRRKIKHEQKSFKNWNYVGNSG